MGVELRPLGVQCNIQCQYCYQNPQRDAGNFNQSYDIELMKAAIEAEGGSFALFGGEPLLVPEQDLENLWSWGLEHFGYNTVQTNGTLISDEHIRMFRAYKVNVGISIDGPGELNDVRWGLENDQMTAAHLSHIPALQHPSVSFEGRPPVSKLAAFKLVRTWLAANNGRNGANLFPVFNNAFTHRLNI